MLVAARQACMSLANEQTDTRAFRDTPFHTLFLSTLGRLPYLAFPLLLAKINTFQFVAS